MQEFAGSGEKYVEQRVREAVRTCLPACALSDGVSLDKMLVSSLCYPVFFVPRVYLDQHTLNEEMEGIGRALIGITFKEEYTREATVTEGG